MRIRSKHVLSVTASAATVAVIILAVWWAISTVHNPPSEPVPTVGPVVYQVEEGSVGRSLEFNAFSEWPIKGELSGTLSGTVTEIMIDDGQLVSSGDVIMSVDLSPHAIIEGSIPAFRDLQTTTKGPDVEQLQVMLADGGWYEGEIDGIYNTATRQAVKRWQLSNGMKDDGVVNLGEVTFMSGLPARLDMLISVGDRHEGTHEAFASVLDDAPQFWIPLNQQQQQLIPAQANITVRFPDGQTTEAVISESHETAEEIDLYLTGIDGGSLCSTHCIDIPIGSRSTLRADVSIVEDKTGPIVPLSAITIDPSGNASVVLESGETQDITILAEDRGLAIIDGLTVGTSILLTPE